MAKFARRLSARLEGIMLRRKSGYGKMYWSVVLLFFNGEFVNNWGHFLSTLLMYPVYLIKQRYTRDSKRTKVSSWNIGRIFDFDLTLALMYIIYWIFIVFLTGEFMKHFYKGGHLYDLPFDSSAVVIVALSWLILVVYATYVFIRWLVTTHETFSFVIIGAGILWFIYYFGIQLPVELIKTPVWGNYEIANFVFDSAIWTVLAVGFILHIGAQRALPKPRKIENEKGFFRTIWDSKTNWDKYPVGARTRNK